MKPLRKGMWTSLLVVGIMFAQTVGVGNAGEALAAQKPVTDYAVHPAKDAIAFGLQKGYLWNFADGKFYPDKQIVQGQFVAGLLAIRGTKETESVSELPAGHWAKGIYERAKKAGILADVKIDPNKLLTKEEAAQLVFNAWKPYRGVKMKGYTNTGALITWGWMEPAPQGQPKFREDLPVTRADAAKILRCLWQDKWQLELGLSLANEFHKSLTVSNGIISGTVPKGNIKYSINVNFINNQDKIIGFHNGENFKVNLANVKTAMVFNIMNIEDSSDAALFWYTKLPSLERANMTQKFSN